MLIIKKEKKIKFCKQYLISSFIFIMAFLILQSQLLTSCSAQDTSHPLNRFIRDMQLKYVERSYQNNKLECFTDVDLAKFKTGFKVLQADILSEPSFAQIEKLMSHIPNAERKLIYERALKVYAPTWTEIGEVSSKGQTLAGQTAEKMIAKYVVDVLTGKIKKITPTVEKPTTLIWQDEFDSVARIAPNSQKWGYNLGGDGWGNEELEYYTNSINNAFVENGVLTIHVIEESYKNRSYTSARLVTDHLFSTSEGRIEVKAKLPYGQGIWPAIWLLPQNNTYGSYEKNGEIDIMELVGNDMNTTYGSLHYYMNGKVHSAVNVNDETVSFSKVDYSKEFHIFAVEWNQNWMRWYVDGHPYGSIRMEKLFNNPSFQPFKQPFYILLNVAVGGTWPGAPNEKTKFPQEMIIDYVRVYQ